MRYDDLVSEGRSLVRPSLELTTSRDLESSSARPAGLWGARRSVESPDGETMKHIVSVDCEWLKKQGLPVAGSLSLYSDGLDVVTVLEGRSSIESGTGGGELLWGTEKPSFPPPEALCLNGSQKLEAWLTERGWSREDGAEAVIHRTPEGQAYVREWQRRCPLYQRDPPVAVLGGWPVMWPDDDVYGRRGRLVLWTFRDAEPWFEVWVDPSGRLSAVARMT